MSGNRPDLDLDCGHIGISWWWMTLESEIHITSTLPSGVVSPRSTIEAITTSGLSQILLQKLLRNHIKDRLSEIADTLGLAVIEKPRP